MKKRISWKKTTSYAEFHLQRIYKNLMEIKDDCNLTAEYKLIHMTWTIDEIKLIANVIKHGVEP